MGIGRPGPSARTRTGTQHGDSGGRTSIGPTPRIRSGRVRRGRRMGPAIDPLRDASFAVYPSAGRFYSPFGSAVDRAASSRGEAQPRAAGRSSPRGERPALGGWGRIGPAARGLFGRPGPPRVGPSAAAPATLVRAIPASSEIGPGQAVSTRSGARPIPGADPRHLALSEAARGTRCPNRVQRRLRAGRGSPGDGSAAPLRPRQILSPAKNGGVVLMVGTAIIDNAFGWGTA